MWLFLDKRNATYRLFDLEIFESNISIQDTILSTAGYLDEIEFAIFTFYFYIVNIS